MLLDRIRHLRRWQWNEQRPTPTYDDILRVAVALSRINAQLIERQFAINPDAATTFMARLVEESHFDEIGADGWHYPLLRGEQLRRSRRLETERRRPMSPDKRFDALRRLIAKELHPDFCTGGDLEKLVRSECFKRLWPEIERLVERK